MGPWASISASVNILEVCLHQIVNEDPLIGGNAAAIEQAKIGLNAGCDNNNICLNGLSAVEFDNFGGAIPLADGLDGGAAVKFHSFSCQPAFDKRCTVDIEHAG